MTPNCQCSTCHLPIYRNPSERKASQSGLFFCGYSCKASYRPYDAKLQLFQSRCEDFCVGQNIGEWTISAIRRDTNILELQETITIDPKIPNEPLSLETEARLDTAYQEIIDKNTEYRGDFTRTYFAKRHKNDHLQNPD